MKMINFFKFFVIFLSVSTTTHANTIKDDHLRAIELGRSGNYAQSLAIFEKILSKDKPDKKIRVDYILVLGWAEKCIEATFQFEKVTGDFAPYILNQMGKCYRNLKQFDQAIKVYKRSLKNNPNQKNTLLGLAYAYIDSKNLDKAFLLFTNTSLLKPNDPDLLILKGYAYESENKYLKAYETYNRILKKDPNHIQAIKRKIKALSLQGAHHLALEKAQEYKNKLGQDFIHNLKNNIAAQKIRWGKLIYEPSLDLRWRQTDQALQILSDILRENPNNLRARFDYIVGLFDREDNKRVIAEFESLLKENKPVPLWLKIVAADAYANNYQTDKAINFFNEALKKNPFDYSILYKVYQAYLISNQLKKAKKVLDKIVVNQASPLMVSGGLTQPNWQKVEAETAKGWFLAYQDNLSMAEERFVDLLSKAPGNNSIRSGLAHVYLWKGEPTKSLKEFKWILSRDPDYLESLIGYSHTLINLSDYKTAQLKINSLKQEHPNSRHVKKLLKRWQAYRNKSIDMNNHYVVEENDQSAWLTQLKFNSTPLFYNYRIFFDYTNQQAKATEETHTDSRVGAGLSYNGKNGITAKQHLSFDIDKQSDIGSMSSVGYQANDKFLVEGSYNSFSLDIPLKARTQGIEATSFESGASYNLNDRNSLNINGDFFSFSDNNKRFSYGLSLKNKIISGSSYRSFLIPQIYGSTNSGRDRVYFNPEHDFSFSVSTIHEWSHYQFFSDKFKHTFSLNLGVYAQSGYSPSLTGQINYEHVWEFDPGKTLSYSFQFNRRAFDGNIEYEPAFYLNMSYHF